jgi:predicted HNH restriction endonuclease
MAENVLGRNITFPIYYDDNGTRRSFHDLVMQKATLESVVMSLGDKVTGDVYYKDNTLSMTMKEYILVDGVKYFLVNPPTIVREGTVSDNSQLKGMTKYAFVFYHPMYKLGNFPFTDIAVTDEEFYLSQNKTFYWTGTLFNFIDKLNANLANSEWVVISNIAQDSDMWEKARRQR